MTTIHAVHVDRFETGLAVLVNPSGRQFRVPQSCVHDLPPSATEAERRLVEAMVEWLPLYSTSPKYVVSVLGSAAANALNAVRAERKPPDPVDPLALLAAVVELHDKETCRHEDTHRGGSIWTICDICGRKWADDRGGFQPYSDPPAIAQARAALAASRSDKT